MRKLFFIGVLLVTIAARSHAQQVQQDSAYNFTIQDCVNYAYQHQHDITNAALDVKSADYRVKEIIGQGLPQINGSASFQDYIKSPVILFPDFVTPSIYGVLAGEGVIDSAGNRIKAKKSSTLTPVNFTQKYNSSIGATASQILFDPNYIVGLQSRRTYKELYARSYSSSKITVNVNVTKAYYQVLVSVEQLKLLDADLAQLKQQRDETVARNKQGFVELVDVDRITVQYNSLVTTRENTMRMLDLNYQLLKFQMGMPIDKPLYLKDKLEDIKLDPAVAIATADTSVYKNRIEYNLLETQKRLNEFSLKSTKGQYLPKLSANASYSAAYQSNSFSNLYSSVYPSAYVGLNLTIPIFSGFQHQNQVRQSEITVLKSQTDLDNVKNEINLQVSRARIYYINGLQTLNDQKKNRDLAQEVLDVSKVKYEQGVGSSIEVTQAQTSLEDADNSYIQGLYDALISKVDLDQAYGRIQ